MPLLQAEALTAVKARLEITDTSFDTLLNQMILDNVKRLFPRLMVETDRQAVTIAPVNGEAIVDISTLGVPLVDVRLVELTGSVGEYPVSNVYVHKAKLRIRELPSGTTNIYIYGLIRPVLANLDDEYHLSVIFFVMADFFNYLVGSKRKYNEYMQNGAPQVDEMRDLADFYENKAIAELDDHAPRYGRQ